MNGHIPLTGCIKSPYHLSSIVAGLQAYSIDNIYLMHVNRMAIIIHFNGHTVRETTRKKGHDKTLGCTFAGEREREILFARSRHPEGTCPSNLVPIV